MSTPEFTSLKLDLSTNGVLIIMFSRPGGNAMNTQLFEDWHNALQWARSASSVKVVVQTGSGKYYSSGKDLGPTKHESFEKEMNHDMDVLEGLIDALIQFPKPLIAAVNGPAIGFGVTSLAHFDFVYAVPNATFAVPFMRWGFCAEGCSSALFPKLMGKQVANELLLAGETVSAQKLEARGFLEVLTGEEFLQAVLKKAVVMAGFDSHTVDVTKKLVHEREMQDLMATNHRELSMLRRMMMRDQSRNPIQNFVDERAKKQKSRHAKM